jgi:orotidine-5'-phosphate decarboxylase
LPVLLFTCVRRLFQHFSGDGRSCGIGAQGPEPGSAINAGADFEIIGRKIYGAKDPRAAIIEINDAIKRATK